MTLATLIVCTDEGRAKLYARAERALPADEVIVQVKDLVGRHRSFRTSLTSPRAELVATEPPLVLRGGLTALVAYYRVPSNATDAIERHYEDGEFSHLYELRLRVACHGTARRRALPA